jgi:type IV pilus assembly protein PilC
MPYFNYQAVNTDGKSITAKIEATSRKDLIDKLKIQNLYPVDIEEIDPTLNRGLVMPSRVKSADIAVFLRQLSTLIKTGVPIIDSLSIIKNQLKEGKLKRIVSDVYENIHKGSAFSDALSKHPEVFTNMMVNMIEAGEVSGALDMVIERLATTYEKDEKIKRKIKGALIYPMVLTIVATAVIIFMLAFVMPTFVGMFESSGVPLPTPTKIMIKVGNVIRVYWYMVIAGIAALVLGFRFYGKTPEGRLRMDHMKMLIPYVKTVTTNLITSRFARTLSTLLFSGIPLLDALENTSKVMNNAVAERDILNARTEVRMGHELAAPIAMIPYLPSMLSSMIRIGEESGALDDLLERTAEFYEDEVEASIQQMTAIFEPVLIVVMGIVLGFIIVAMALPMFDMVKTVG